MKDYDYYGYSLLNVTYTLKPQYLGNNESFIDTSKPTHMAKFGLGGYRTLDYETDLKTLPYWFKEKGMLVFTREKQQLWILNSLPQTTMNDDGDLIYDYSKEEWIEIPFIGGYRISDEKGNIPNEVKVVGMTVYDQSDNELKLYNGTDENGKDKWEVLPRIDDIPIVPKPPEQTYFIVEKYQNLKDIEKPQLGYMAFVKHYDESIDHYNKLFIYTEVEVAEGKYESKWIELKTGGDTVGTEPTEITIGKFEPKGKDEDGNDAIISSDPAIFVDGKVKLVFKGNIDNYGKTQIELDLSEEKEYNSDKYKELIIKISKDFILDESNYKKE
jgi:hypothetical protein